MLNIKFYSLSINYCELNKFIQLLVLCSILLSSCSQNKDIKTNYVEVIPVGEALDKEDEVYLSDYAKSIKYIKLESNPSCLISKHIDKLMIRDSILIISDRKSIFLFTIQGKFIKKLGNQGKGPSEYSQVTDFTISQDGNTIIVYDWNQKKIIRYDIAGDFLGEFSITGYPALLNTYGENILAAYVFPDYYFNDFYTFAEISQKGEILGKYLKREEDDRLVDEKSVLSLPTTSRVSFEFMNDTLTYWETSLNIVYKIDQNQISARFFFDYDGKYDDNTVLEDQIKSNNTLISFGLFHEVKNCIFLLSGLYNNKNYNILYDKNTKKIFNMKFDHSDLNFQIKSGFINDIDGGYPFLPFGVISENKVYCYFYPYMLQNKMKDEIFENIKIKNPSQRERLNEILNASKEQDNPIIMIAEFK